MTERRELLAVLAVVALLSSLAAPGATARKTDRPFDAYLTALEMVRGKFVEEKEVSDLVEDSIKGVVGVLDPESLILEAGEKTGPAGIGVRVGIRLSGPGVLILDVAEGGAAAKAGLRAGDRLLRIDGRNVFGKKRLVVERMLAGPADSRVRVLWANGDGEYWEKSLTRGPVSRPSWRRVVMDGVTLIQVFRLQARAAVQIKDALRSAGEGGTPGAVLDLRRASGGSVDAALDLAGSCFAGEELLAIGQAANPRYARQYVSEKKKDSVAVPLVLLVGPYTQGAAELLAAPLKEHRRATLVGTRTFGFASRQKDFPLTADAGKRLKLTVERFLSPSSVSLTSTGVGADIDTGLLPRARIGAVYRRRAIVASLVERLIEAPPGVFDAPAIKSGKLELSAEAGKDKSVAGRRVIFEESFAIAEESLLRELGIEVPREDLNRQRPAVISRVRVLLARRFMERQEALKVELKEDQEVVLALNVLKAGGIIKRGGGT